MTEIMFLRAYLELLEIKYAIKTNLSTKNSTPKSGIRTGFPLG